MTGEKYIMQQAANRPPLLFPRQVEQVRVRPGWQAFRPGKSFNLSPADR
jgi:hypothetical protein